VALERHHRAPQATAKQELGAGFKGTRLDEHDGVLK
jgi:hypothetical protein